MTAMDVAWVPGWDKKIDGWDDDLVCIVVDKFGGSIMFSALGRRWLYGWPLLLGMTSLGD